jgi:hypothetical protein
VFVALVGLAQVARRIEREALLAQRRVRVREAPERVVRIADRAARISIASAEFF